MIGNRRESMIQAVEFLPGKVEPKLLGALSERMPPAVLTEHQFAFRHAHRAGVDNFVGAFVLEISILVYARLVRERVAPHNRFVRLRAESDERAEQLAGRIEMLRLDGGAVGV